MRAGFFLYLSIYSIDDRLFGRAFSRGYKGDRPKGELLIKIQKIISGGQTGAARAALDVALKLGIEYGGWIPRGRLTEDGPLPGMYRLEEMPTSSYTKRTRQNILDSDGTLILSHGALADGAAMARQTLRKCKRPWLHVDLHETAAFQAALDISDWVEDNRIAVLHVTGPRAGTDSDIYKNTLAILESAYYLCISAKHISGGGKKTSGFTRQPQTLEEAVSRIVSDLPLKDKVTLANMAEVELDALHSTLGSYICRKFGLWTGNKALVESCRFVSGNKNLEIRAVPGIIIQGLWKHLKKSHKLRIVE